MDKYLVRLPTKLQEKSEQSEFSAKRRIAFQEPNSYRESLSQRQIVLVQQEQFITNWPEPPVCEIPDADQGDPFPLFLPSNPRYFDQSDSGHRHGADEAEAEPGLNLPCASDELHSHNQGTVLVGKHYVYTQDGTIKDLFVIFKKPSNSEDRNDLGLTDQINHQLLQTIVSTDTGKALENEVPPGDVDGWNEDNHTPLFWNSRMREVGYFVHNETWSIDPVGDWSYLNTHAIPKGFLRKIRRYFEMRPLEYLRDTGSYRIFHIVNQYNDLNQIMESQQGYLARAGKWLKKSTIGCGEKLDPIERAKAMELDYQVLVWLSLWDAELRANVFQLKEMSMTDWFFTWVDWKSAIGVQNLLTKNEIHAFDNFWDYRPVQDIEDESQEEDNEDLDDWMAGGEEDDEEMEDNVIDGGTQPFM